MDEKYMWNCTRIQILFIFSNKIFQIHPNYKQVWNILLNVSIDVYTWNVIQEEEWYMFYNRSTLSHNEEYSC